MKPRDQWKNLTYQYFLSFLIIVMFFIVTYLWIDSLQRATSHSETLINYAGRQRMLSQRLVRTVLMLERDLTDAEIIQYRDELKMTLDDWQKGRDVLLNGDIHLDLTPITQPEIRSRLITAGSYFDAMRSAGQCVFDNLISSLSCADTFQTSLNILITNQGEYLTEMDQLVFDLQHALGSQRQHTQEIELIVFIMLLTSFCLIGFVLIRPIVQQTDELLAKLDESYRDIKRNEHILDEAARLAKVGAWEVELDTMTPIWMPEIRRIHEIESDHKLDMEEAINFYAPGARQIVRDAIKNGLESGEGWDFEAPFITAKGNRKWVRSIGMVDVENGKAARMYGVFQDITDQYNTLSQVKQSESLLRNLIEQLPDAAIIIFDNILRYTLAEGPFLERAGYSREGMLNKTLYEVLSPEQIERLEPQYLRVLNGEQISFERHEDDLDLHYEAKMLPLRNNNEIIGGLIVVRDTLHAHKTQQRIKIIADEFRRLADNAPIGIFRATPEGQAVYVNPYTAQLVSSSPDTALGNGWARYLHPDDRSTVMTTRQATLLQGKPFDMEYRFNHPERGTIWVHSRAIPLFDQDGNYYEYIGTLLDITERKKLDDEIRQANQTLQLYVEASNDGFWDWDLTSNEIYFSPRWKEQLGYCDHELDNTLAMWSSVIFDEDRKNALQMVEDYNTDRIPQFLGMQRFHHKDGSTVHVLSRAVHTRNEAGKVVRMVGAHTDISELVRAREAAENANIAKSIFLANMSHELRTPLNAIIGFTQLLERQNRLSSEDQHHLHIIQRNGNHLLELINDILEISRIEAGQTQRNDTVFDLHLLLSDLNDIFTLRAQNRGLNFTCDYAPELPRFVQTDQRKLRQILINLIGNAIKFTSAGEITVRVRQARQQLYFEIEDTGIGIEPEELPRLFEPFTQAQAGQQASEGTGLGLTISKHFVEILGGELHIESKPDKGTLVRFYIRSEFVEQYSPEEIAPIRMVEGIKNNTGQWRILVADDLEESRILLQSLLEPHGFNVTTVEDGVQAVEITQTWQPHLVLMDMRMPRMDGYEAIHQIKQLFREKPPVIVAVTASAFEYDREKILGVGCDDFVSKPFQIEILLEKIGKHLGLEFTYASEPSLKGSTVSSYQGWQRDLTLVSQPLRSHLLQAVRQLDTGQSEQIIEGIHEINPQLAAILRQLIEEFRFDIIRRLLEEIEDYHDPSPPC